MRAVQPAVGSGPESPTQWGRWPCRGRARSAGQAVGDACARASACPMGAPLWAEGPAASRLRCPRAEAGAGRMGSGGRLRRKRRHAGAGPVAVAGRCGRSSRRPAVAPRAPHSGVGGHAGGERVVQAKLRGEHAQGRRCARWGPLCGPWDLRLAGSAARGVGPRPGAWVAAGALGRSGVHGPECQRRVRGGVCGPAGGRWPH